MFYLLELLLVVQGVLGLRQGLHSSIDVACQVVGHGKRVRMGPDVEHVVRQRQRSFDVERLVNRVKGDVDVEGHRHDDLGV